MDKKMNNNSILSFLVIVLLIGLIGFVAWFLTNGTEERISSDVQMGGYKALSCNTSKNPENAFFVYDGVQRFTHTIKVLFNNDSQLKEISYRYDGVFNSDNAAKDAEAWIHADYNKYMAKNGISSGSLSPVFSVSKSKLLVSLYAESKTISREVAKLFFLSEEEYDIIHSYSIEDYERLFKSKGFTCKIHE